MNRSWKFTIKDFLLILFILLLALIFVLKMNVARTLDQPPVTFEIVLRVEAKEAFMLDQVKVGDKIYQKGSPVVFGEVVSVVHEQATSEITNVLTGEIYIEQPVENRFNLLITIRSNGNKSVNGTPIIDNNMITVNQYLVVNNNRVHLPSRVMSIVEKG